MYQNFNAARQDMYRMRIIRSKLGNIHHVLEDIHKGPTATTSLGKENVFFFILINNIMVSPSKQH